MIFREVPNWTGFTFDGTQFVKVSREYAIIKDCPHFKVKFDLRKEVTSDLQHMSEADQKEREN